MDELEITVPVTATWDVLDDVGHMWTREIGEFTLYAERFAKGEWYWEVCVSEHLMVAGTEAFASGNAGSRNEAMQMAEHRAQGAHTDSD